MITIKNTHTNAKPASFKEYRIILDPSKFDVVSFVEKNPSLRILCAFSSTIYQYEIRELLNTFKNYFGILVPEHAKNVCTHLTNLNHDERIILNGLIDYFRNKEQL